MCDKCGCNNVTWLKIKNTNLNCVYLFTYYTVQNHSYHLIYTSRSGTYQLFPI